MELPSPFPSPAPPTAPPPSHTLTMPPISARRVTCAGIETVPFAVTASRPLPSPPTGSGRHISLFTQRDLIVLGSHAHPVISHTSLLVCEEMILFILLTSVFFFFCCRDKRCFRGYCTREGQVPDVHQGEGVQQRRLA